MADVVESLRFLSDSQAAELRQRWGTPCYVYDERQLRRQAAEALAFPHAFGLTVRYAIKANPNAALLRLFDACGLHFDASSGFEAWRAMRAGVDGNKVSLSAQQMPEDFAALAEQGIRFVATSLRQLEAWAAAFSGGQVALRLNPGVGSGGNNRTNVGGRQSSFGIWHEYLDAALEIAKRQSLRIDRLHTHIGSGSDPQVWGEVAELSLGLAERLPDVTQVNLGGGYKVARMQDETATDLQQIGEPVRVAFERFAARTGRQLELEIEPGTFLVANAGALVTTVTEVVDTGTDGYTFLRTDAGLNDILRPAMYGSQHPIVVVPQTPTTRTGDYIVVGHCCETGDIMSPAPGNPEAIRTRRLTAAAVNDLVVVEGAGAYCAAMAASNYNSFPICPEILIREDGSLDSIRRRQTLAEMLQLESP